MNRRLGELSYARALLEDLPQMDDGELLQYLYELTRKKSAGEWPFPAIVLRALLLEFSVGFARRGAALPEELIEMLAEQLRLPRDFVDDPQPVYSGDRSNPSHRSMRELMFEVDAGSVVSTGGPLTSYAMRKRLKELTGQTVSIQTIERWRDSEWQSWLEIVSKR